MAFASSIFYAFLFLQLSFGSNFGEIIVKPTEDHDDQSDLDPALSVFFRVNDLYLGKKMPIYFATNDDSAPTHLLTREEVDSIPFASSKLPYLLEFFSITYKSPQAKAMEMTLLQCELEPKEGEIQFCATSLESMLDMTRGVLGMVKLKVLTTKILNSNHTLFQGYTFVDKPLEIYAPKMVACHTMAYPYLVYYCHGQKDHFNRLFKIALRGENEERVDAMAVCHMNTSTWDPDHVAFRVLGGRPGISPICHFLPADNVVWVASP